MRIHELRYEDRAELDLWFVLLTPACKDCTIYKRAFDIFFSKTLPDSQNQKHPCVPEHFPWKHPSHPFVRLFNIFFNIFSQFHLAHCCPLRPVRREQAAAHPLAGFRDERKTKCQNQSLFDVSWRALKSNFQTFYMSGMPQDTTPIGVEFPHSRGNCHPFFHLFLLLKHRERSVCVCVGGQEGERHIIIQDLSSPPGLISFSSFFFLTHSRQLIITLFPQIPQCTCNYHAHACLPPARSLEGGVSLSLSFYSVFTSLTPPPILLWFSSSFSFTWLFFPSFLSFQKKKKSTAFSLQIVK